MSYVHSTPGNTEWVDTGVPIADAQSAVGDNLDQRFAHLDAVSPDVSSILRQISVVIQRQQDQLSRMQTEMNEQFRYIRTRLESATPIAAFDDNNQAGANSNKRTASPSGQAFSYPPQKSARTANQSHRSSSANANQSAYFDPSQPQSSSSFVDYPSMPYLAPRIGDMDASNTNAFVADEHQHHHHHEGGMNNDANSQTPRSASKGVPRPRDRPPAEYYTADDTFMNRNVRTLHDLWKEYTVGLDNKPSIKYMNDTWGTRWHYQPKEALYWGVRRHIYQLIEDLRDNKYNGDVDAAIREIQDRMDRENLTSLHKLGQALRAEKGEIVRRPGKSNDNKDKSKKGAMNGGDEGEDDEQQEEAGVDDSAVNGDDGHGGQHAQHGGQDDSEIPIDAALQDDPPAQEGDSAIDASLQ